VLASDVDLHDRCIGSCSLRLSGLAYRSGKCFAADFANAGVRDIANADADADANTDADADANTDANTNSDADANTDSDAIADYGVHRAARLATHISIRYRDADAFAFTDEFECGFG
jgi:hypothetical protein